MRPNRFEIPDPVLKERDVYTIKIICRQSSFMSDNTTWWRDNPLACHNQQGATTCWQHSHHSRTDTKIKYISTHIYSNQNYVMIKSKK
jgi:hypothetical protein